MATPIKRTTKAEATIEMVPSIDSAIDWDASYPGMAPLKVNQADGSVREEDAEDLAERKRETYRRSFSLESVVFKEGGDLPTFFVFKDPNRADVMRHLVDLLSQLEGGKGGGAMYFDILGFALIATKDGQTGDLTAVPRSNETGHVSGDYMQGLLDSRVFGELNAFYMSAFNRARLAQPREKK